jgi:D-3-phosphoglycerate dehydrogenase
VTLPHLGASTNEAEDNCAVMVADTVKDYLENGNIKNSVNFPEVVLPRAPRPRASASPTATCLTWWARSPPLLAGASLNIAELLNKSRGEYAYTLIDTDGAVDATVVDKIRAISGVLAARVI